MAQIENKKRTDLLSTTDCKKQNEDGMKVASNYSVISMVDYTRHAQIGYNLQILRAIPLAQQIISQLSFSQRYPHQPFVMVDYGAAEGSSGTLFFSYIIDWMKQKYGDDLAFIVCFEDQLNNDYNSLFSRVNDTHASSHLKNIHNVFITACATNFYSQCLPTNYVNFGLSSAAVHWLRECPCKMKNDIFATEPSTRASAEEKAMFKKIAANNWEEFLLKRAAELTDGGNMILCNACYDANLYSKHGQPWKFLNCLTDVWQSLVNDGLLTQEEFVNTNFPFYLRTVDEMRAPFIDGTSLVSKACLRLAYIAEPQIFTVEELFNISSSNSTHCSESDITAMLNTVAEKASTAIRAFTYSVFLSSLSDTRNDEFKKAIVEELYKRLPRVLLKSLGMNFYDISTVMLHINKST